MTEKPARTMTLTPYEWRALVATGANNLYSFVGAMTEPVPNREHLLWFNDALDRLKMQASAWAASGQPVAPVPEQPAMTEYLEQIASTNGTGSVVPAGPKKKRGWQKGRKRGPRKPKGGEAVQ